MQMTRRTVLAGIGASVATGWAQPGWTRTAIDLNGMEILSLSDGNLVLPADFFFAGLPQDELAPILQRHGMDGPQLTPPCNVTLLRHEGRVVLFDAGSGAGFMPSAGALVDSLAALDIAPEDVTDIVFTHGHPDHLWGVLDDFDDPAFPEARCFMGQTEWDYWSDPNTVDTIGEARASFAVGSARRLEAIAERCNFFSDGQEVLPGVMAQACFGHTPGHMAFELRSGSEAVLVGGDAIGNHHVAFEKPEWHSGADQDQEMGAASRVRLLDRLAHEQMTLIGFHLRDGGIGRVERKDSGYVFVTGDM